MCRWLFGDCYFVVGEIKLSDLIRVLVNLYCILSELLARETFQNCSSRNCLRTLNVSNSNFLVISSIIFIGYGTPCTPLHFWWTANGRHYRENYSEALIAKLLASWIFQRAIFHWFPASSLVIEHRAYRCRENSSLVSITKPPGVLNISGSNL